VRKGVTKKWPDLYYLGIGVAQHPQVPLKFPAKDVTGIEKVLKQQQGKVYRQIVTKTLTDQQATRGNLINAISTFFEPAKRGGYCHIVHFWTWHEYKNGLPLCHL